MSLVVLVLSTQIYLNIESYDLPDVPTPKNGKLQYVSHNPYSLFLLKFIRLYQQSFSQVQGDVCNFIPSCSHFGFEAVKDYGLVKGLLLTSDRLQRCHPGAWKYLDEDYGIAHDSLRGDRLFDPPSKYK